LQALTHKGSFGYVETLLAFLPRVSLSVWLKAFGEAWTSCDECWRHVEALGRVIPRGTCHEMMTPDAAAYLRRLPARVKVYRGCDAGLNEAGMSWTTDIKVAERFSTYKNDRYSVARPTILFGEASRDDVTAVFLDRKEREIFVADPAVVTVVHRMEKAPSQRTAKGHHAGL
jgi:hypothetical protein